MILPREDVLLVKLLQFYSRPGNMKIFMDTMRHPVPMSLRLMDFFCTNYCRNNRIYIDDGDVHSDYKNRLTSFKKACFDPFCRNKRIFVSDKSGRSLDEAVDLQYEHIDGIKDDRSNGVVTTVGQLNFFKWCIEKNIFHYILDNIDDIHSYIVKSTNVVNKKEPCQYHTKNLDVKIMFRSNFNCKPLS